MLHVDIFTRIIRDEIPNWLMSVIIHLLTERKCKVFVEKCKSTLKDVPLVCIQGSQDFLTCVPVKYLISFPCESETVSYKGDNT